MTVGTNFIRGSNPIWYLVDSVGRQFDDTYYMWVLTNTIPYIPAPVYHDINGTIPWTDPIEFLANGTLPIDIFFDDTMVYRLEFRKNNGTSPPSQSDQLIYLVENYIPNGVGVSPAMLGNTQTDNQISNGQFSAVNFNPVGTYTLTAVTNPPSVEIAPGWFLDLTGTGNISVQQVPQNTTIANPTGAPYFLEITTSGWTQAILRQRFQQNGQNWQGKHLSSSITAFSPTAVNLLARLDASNGQPLGVVINATLSTIPTQYTTASPTMPVPAYTNLDLPPVAYIDYKIFLPLAGTVFLSSIQLIVADSTTSFTYEEDTIDRQLDHLAHYYQPKFAYKPIPSWLIGWDFPLNPAQILGAGTSGAPLGPFATGVNTGNYFWDQTILFQTVDNSISAYRETNGGLTIKASLAGQVAMIQYLDQTTARKILSDRASVRINASTTAASLSLGGNVTLWACTTVSGNLPTLPTTGISALDANGIPTMGTGTWTQMPNLYQATGFHLKPASTTNSELLDIMLNGWDLAGAVPANTAFYFAIVVGFAPLLVNETITVNSISLCSGDIATRPAPKTHDETLRDCERWYEKSYQASSVAGTATTYNQLTNYMNASFVSGGAQSFLEASFSFQFRTLKRAPTTQLFPSVTIYSPVTGTVGNVRAITAGGTTLSVDNVITRWSTPVIGNKNVSFAAPPQVAVLAGQATVNATTPNVTYINYHYVADARLGVVN